MTNAMVLTAHGVCLEVAEKMEKHGLTLKVKYEELVKLRDNKVQADKYIAIFAEIDKLREWFQENDAVAKLYVNFVKKKDTKKKEKKSKKEGDKKDNKA